MKRVKGKVGIVTGAGQGLGKATALLLAREGAKVIVAEINKETGQKTAKQIKDEGGDAIFVLTDVTKADSVKNMVNVAVKTYGRLDFLNNSAGYEGTPMPIVDVTEEMWDKLQAVNLKSHYLGMKYAIPEMLKSGGGSIVNIASAGGVVGVPTVATYTAAKAGVICLTKSVALEYCTQGIRVNSIAPGNVDTPMIERFTHGDEKILQAFLQHSQPIGRLAKPEEISYMVLFLVSDEASFCTGSCYCVDGGYTAD